jgi:hypothetical protein
MAESVKGYEFHRCRYGGQMMLHGVSSWVAPQNFFLLRVIGMWVDPLLSGWLHNA